MAVLIEGISVVVSNGVVAERFQGGMTAFRALIPHNNFCSDGDLTRVAFMAPPDVQAFVEALEARGLRYVGASGMAETIAVADQRTGFIRACPWATFAHALWQDKPNQTIAVCSAISASVQAIAVPEGWAYESSLSSNHRFVPNDKMDVDLEFIRREDSLDVYRDRKTGVEYYVGRSQ